MTIRRDFYAGKVTALLQCDNTGALRDFSRHQRPVTPNDFATDADDTLFGANSFVGHPSFPGQRLSATLTVEGFAKFNPNGADQTMLAAMSGSYGLATECAWTIIGSNPRLLAFYNGTRGSNQSGGNPTLASDVPVGAWKHFFFCLTPNVCWWGVDGVMSPQTVCGFVSDHIGHESIPFRLNGIDPSTGFTNANAGKLHSLMLTSDLLRYPFTSSGVYTPPDDLLTSWYNDQGDPPSFDNALYDVRRPSYAAAARFRQSGARIAGHVTYSGAAARKRVALYERRTGLLVDQTYSSALDGGFEFVGLSTDSEYFVVGFDDSPGTINAEVSDHLVPA